MLTQAQQKYLLTIPKEKTVTIYPFTKELEQAADELIATVQRAVPDLTVQHLGASALGLSGQGDLDIYTFCDPAAFNVYLPRLIETFGEPEKRGKTSIKWAFEKNGFPVELYLTDPSSDAMQEQIKTFELLRDNEQLRSEYEALKEKMNGRPFRQYQVAKYEFYNRLLRHDLT